MCNRKRGGGEVWTQKTQIDRPPIGVALNQYHAGGLLSWLSGRSHHFLFFLVAHWSINYSIYSPYFQFQGKPPRITLYFLYKKDAKGLIQLWIICHFMKYEYISILINVNFFLDYCNCGDLGLRAQNKYNLIEDYGDIQCLITVVEHLTNNQGS